MAIPGDNVVLRLWQPKAPVLHIEVLDVLSAPSAPFDDIITLSSWQYGSRDGVTQAGLSVDRFAHNGKVQWQFSRELCGPLAGENCGRWILETGAILPVPGGFFVVGTLLNADTSAEQMFCLRLTDAGRLMLIRRFTGTGAVPGRAVGIAPMTSAEEYVVAANNTQRTESWFFQVDGNGVAGGISFSVPGTRVRRLRGTVAQGIIAVGEKFVTPQQPRAWALALDNAGLGPKWERIYDQGPMPDGTGPRWYDIAEGDKGLIAVGNLVDAQGHELASLIAGLENDAAPNPGDVRWAHRPQSGIEFIRLRGVANYGLTGLPLEHFAVCGDQRGSTFLFAIDVDGTAGWQKSYDMRFTGGGTLNSVALTGYQAISGGRTRLIGLPFHGLMVSSATNLKLGDFHCSTETDVGFPPLEVASALSATPRAPFTADNGEWDQHEALPLAVDPGCFDEPQ